MATQLLKICYPFYSPLMSWACILSFRLSKMKNTERKASPCIIGGLGSVIKSLREAFPNEAIQNLDLSGFILKYFTYL